MKTFDILFVCSANVGRSQMAEAYYNSLTGGLNSMSAGIGDFHNKYKGSPAPEIISIMLEDGVDIRQQRVKQLTLNMLSRSQKIVVLCQKAECPEFLLRHKNILFMPITDPYKKGENEILDIRNSVKKLVLNLINQN